MITRAQTRGMVVISDLHLGNPFCRTKRKIMAFLRWAAESDYDICINGDVLEIAQTSFASLARDVPDVFRLISQIGRAGTPTYYVVGNHDLALENFLDDWGALRLAPFLNVDCGPLRVRIEHGHLYDPFFVSRPRLYEAMTRFAGLLLHGAPWLYRLWMFLEGTVFSIGPNQEGLAGESPAFYRAATMLERRGFDAVVFGHTHRTGQIRLPEGGVYLNPGSWMLDCCFICLDEDGIRLCRWDPETRSAVTLAAGADR